MGKEKVKHVLTTISLSTEVRDRLYELKHVDNPRQYWTEYLEKCCDILEKINEEK